ncbi:efflux RND transporter periplasmic adaptor subunit [Hydrogenimonas urashimensis]|uniref:efflux RND transporter periplasmic adaptor subunit n=1 Tax=Hydrogenimonas urashimensis TaxID=2740515 RepID=UPI001915CB06|nr:efflux RND transporter periplasmic adaptor subunit [Hydrogenimonas urashimensis]
MKKMISILLVSLISLYAHEIETDVAVEKTVGKTVRTNAKVVQLSNQRQTIVARVAGHLEKYFVQPGAEVKRGDAVAKIKSLALSKMTARYLALETKRRSAGERLESTRRLYAKGLASRQDLNREAMALASIDAELDTLKSQLTSLGIDAGRLEKPTDTLIVRAHMSGRIETLHLPLHANFDAETPIVSLVQKSGYYAIAYLDVEAALHAPKKVEGVFSLGDERFDCRYLTLMPSVDEETQRAQMLFAIESGSKPLLLNAYGQMQLQLPPFLRRIVVKRTALTMLEGEWVVFVPVKEEKEAHTDHAEEAHEHEVHETLPYEARVVKVLGSFGDEVAVEGIEAGESYVSDGVWFIKSMLLKEAVGEHGH